MNAAAPGALWECHKVRCRARKPGCPCQPPSAHSPRRVSVDPLSGCCTPAPAVESGASRRSPDHGPLPAPGSRSEASLAAEPVARRRW
eukprot:3703161-Prorocentrum_lima.AAC.1